MVFLKTREQKTELLFGLFITALILANTLGIKIISIFGVRVSVGIFFIPLIFLVTDIITEVHGKKKAKNWVLVAVVALAFSLIMMYVTIKIAPHELWPFQESFADVFGSSIRMTIASIIAFAISQFHDVFAFDFLKRKTKGKYLWLRNNASTIVSQFIDTTIFMFIAFYKIAPKFGFWFIVSLIIPYWLFKIGFAIIDTPFCYIGVKWLKKTKKS